MTHWGERSTFLARDLIHFSLLARQKFDEEVGASPLVIPAESRTSVQASPLLKGEKEGVKDSGAALTIASFAGMT